MIIRKSNLFFLMLLLPQSILLFTGAFIPISVFTSIFLLISRQKKVRVDPALFIFSVCLLMVSIANSLRLEFFNLKDLLKYLDIALLSLTVPRIVLSENKQQSKTLWTIYAMFLIIWIANYEQTLNSNAIYVPVFFLLLIALTGPKYYYHLILYSVISGLYGSLTVLFSGLSTFFARTRLKATLILAGVVTVYSSLIIFSQYIFPFFVSLAIRLDIIVNTLYAIREQFAILDWLLGRPDLFESFTNRGYTALSGYVYQGDDPHNLFIYVLCKNGILGFCMLLFLFSYSIRAHKTTISFVSFLVLFSIFEPAFSHVFWGVFAIARAMEVCKVGKF